MVDVSSDTSSHLYDNLSPALDDTAVDFSGIISTNFQKELEKYKEQSSTEPQNDPSQKRKSIQFKVVTITKEPPKPETSNNPATKVTLRANFNTVGAKPPRPPRPSFLPPPKKGGSFVEPFTQPRQPDSPVPDLPKPLFRSYTENNITIGSPKRPDRPPPAIPQLASTYKPSPIPPRPKQFHDPITLGSLDDDLPPPTQVTPVNSEEEGKDEEVVVVSSRLPSLLMRSLRTVNNANLTLSVTSRGFTVAKKNPFQPNLTLRKRKIAAGNVTMWLNPDKEGPLLKESARNKWNGKWYILKEDKLFYFKSKPTEGEHSCNCIELKKYDINKKTREIDSLLLYCVEFSHKEDEDFFTLSAQNEIQLNSWYEAFMKARDIVCEEVVVEEGYTKVRVPVEYIPETGEFVSKGLPEMWQQWLRSSEIASEHIQKFPTEIINVLTFQSNWQSQNELEESSSDAIDYTVIADLVGLTNLAEDPKQIYVDFEEISTCPFGVIFLARDFRNNQKVAIKKLHVSSKNVKLIISEIKLQQMLKHPNIVTYRGCYLLGASELWLVTEFQEGGHVKSLIKSHNRPISEEIIANICGEVLRALYYIHSTTRVHREVKSNFVFLFSSGKVKLVDLGSLSKHPKDDSIPYWLSPECIVKQVFGPEADVWSVGILALELAGIEVVSNTFTKTIFEISTQGAPELTGDWSNSFFDFVRQCLQMDPQNRPSAAELFEHEFIQKACSVREMQNLAERLLQKRESDVYATIGDCKTM